MILLLVGVGLYIGVTNFMQQYAVTPSGSNAGQYACAPNVVAAKVNQKVTFSASLPEGTQYYWSAPDSTASFIISGPLTTQYGRAGTKTVYLFYIVNDKWYRTSCTTQILQ